MNVEEEISGNARLQSTHFFVYKGEKFPFNMKLFKCFSQYFKINKNRFKDTTEISIFDDSDEKYDLTGNTIKDFIDFCQSKNISLNKENAPSLHRLAKKYIVPLLIDSTNEFIQKHQKEVVVDLLILNLKDKQFDSTEYEELISNNLPYYINDERLLKLPISVLNRILTKYNLKKPDDLKNDQICTQITEFLFKCLDNHGREASVLFGQIDLSRSKNNAKNRLLFEYAGKFDFHFINGQLLKTVYELESELIKRTEKMKEEQATHKKEIKDLIQKQKEKDDQIQQKNENIESLINQQENKIQQIKSDFQRQLNDMNETVRQLTEKVTQQASLIDNLNQQLKEIKQSPSYSSRFISESNPRGIISLIGSLVTLTCGASDDSNYPISNIKNFDMSAFINNNHSHPNLESDTYITFDFGARKIDLHSYFIHSAGYHPKSWRIDGSNDQSNWTPIDKRTNNQNLNSGNHQYYFECQEAKHENESFRFRYIRYSQQDSWANGDPYRVYLYYFELYGDVFNN